MCVEIMFFNEAGEGRLITKTNELERMLGKRPVDKTGTPVGVLETCLCPVDLQRTAAEAGYEVLAGWDISDCDIVMKPKGVSLRTC